MQPFQRILLFFVLPAIAPLLFPPNILQGAWYAIVLVILLFAALGYALTRRRLTALTLSIFLQGLNVIVRLMMFYPRAMTPDGTPQWMFIITSVLSIALSLYLVLRLDRVDIRAQMA
jgi:hypothetical protein